MIDSVKGIIEAKSASYLDELESMSGTWDGEVKLKTKYVSLMVIYNFYCQNKYFCTKYLLIETIINHFILKIMKSKYFL